MMRNLAVGLGALPFVVFGCASGFPGVRPLAYETRGEAHVYATGDKCIHEVGDKEFGGPVAAVLTGVASTLLKNFGTALSEGAKGGALPSSSSTLNLQLDAGKIPKCIVIVRGAFQPAGHAQGAVVLADFLGLPANAADQRKRLADLEIPPTYRIDHFIELRLGASNNSKALTFVPVFVQINRAIDGAGSGEVDLSIALKFNRVGADDIGSALVLANRSIGTRYKPDLKEIGSNAYEAPWFGSFHASAALAGLAAANSTPPSVPPTGAVGGGGTGSGAGGISRTPSGTPGSDAPSMRSASAHAVPVTVTTTVVETRPTKEGLAFVAAVFNEIQPKIEESISPLIDSNARRSAEAAETTSKLETQANFATADGAARVALFSYCSATSVSTDAVGMQDRITKSASARAAQLKANIAAIKAEEEQPYSSFVTISANLPLAVNKKHCDLI